MRILIIGDSQAGNPGAAAKRELESLGHTVTQVHNDGHGPVSYVNDATLWSQFTTLARQNDLVVLIFGHNDLASPALTTALTRLRNGVAPPVWMSGPPQYPNAADQTKGLAIRALALGVFGARYIDAYPFTSTSLPRDAAGWHLTPAAAAPWGQAIAHVVAQQRTGSTGGGWGTIGTLGAIALGLWSLFRR